MGMKLLGVEDGNIRENGAAEVSVLRYKPVGASIIVRRLERTRTKSGLHVPSNIERSLTEGVILAVGNGRLRDDGQRSPVQFKVGEVILYSDPAGVAFDLEAPDLRILLEDNVLCLRSEDEQ